MSGGQLGVLHTNSSYAPAQPGLPSIGDDIKLMRLAMQISALEAKEDAFANHFGYPNLESFIAGVRKILQANPSDMRALQQFSSTNLQKHLEKFKHINSDIFTNQKIVIRFNAEKSKAQDIFNSSGGSGTITWKMVASDEHIFELTWNTSVVKSIVNKIEGKQFHTQKTNLDRIVSFIRSEAKNLIQVGVNGKTIDQYIVEQKISPFDLTPTEFKEIANNNPKLVAQLQTKITNFIYNDLCAGATDDFKNAVNKVMQTKGLIPKNLSEWAFFMGGKGWASHAIGAFGELQTAIFFQYISNKTPNKLLGVELARIIGDERNLYNQQLHTDIEILKAFGIQVKNYGSDKDFRTGMEKTINVHLHPSEIASLGASEGVVDYIVNSYFNISISPYSESSLNDFFKSHASELLNLDFNPEIPDQVSFYMIGSNFIPGSAILKQAFQEATLKVNTTISGAQGYTDVGYAAGEHPLFLNWWHGNKYIGWNPTDQNSISAWDGKVSITTSFTYSAIFEGHYKLF